MIDGSVLQSAQQCFEKKSRVVVKMVVKHHQITLQLVDQKQSQLLLSTKLTKALQNGGRNSNMTTILYMKASSLQD